MKYRVLGNVAVTKSGRKRVIAKWLLYAAALVLFYALMRSGAFRGVQPVLLIPLSTAVAMREQELSSSVFSFFCGLYIDCAYGFVFGFSAFWLILMGVSASLLARNLVQRNFLNFLWLSAAATLVEFFMDYLFYAVVWDLPNREVLLTESILPTVAATVVVSPLVYFLIKAISARFGDESGGERYTPTDGDGDESGENV
ncbi:MAG: rod shape-determining protein MreD [Bacteroides sp.]|nr:rod shape-determining protein MreD [Eubacterium sp.]MCM1417759.1 rod shape-determining protein MreD [Roseburia sp.]MCM1461350.1 rod shape-determining protein MreD [Bacteroides sp.]